MPRNTNGMVNRRTHSQIEFDAGHSPRAPVAVSQRGQSDAMSQIMQYGSPEEVRPQPSQARGFSEGITRASVHLAGPDTISPQDIRHAIDNRPSPVPGRQRAAWPGAQRTSLPTCEMRDPGPQVHA